MASSEVLNNANQSNLFPNAIRIAARIFSYIFHPLFVPIYVGFFLIYEARLFPERSGWEKKIIIIQFFIYYTFLPLMTTFLSKALGFVESVQLKSQKDRIVPLVVCEIFYFWGWYVFKNLPFPKEVIQFSLAVFLACSFGLILNAFLKVSIHAISVGVLSAFLLISGMQADVSYGLYISIAFLIAGITATSRLIDSNHTEKEIYYGFFAGILAQVTAYFFV